MFVSKKGFLSRQLNLGKQISTKFQGHFMSIIRNQLISSTFSVTKTASDCEIKHQQSDERGGWGMVKGEIVLYEVVFMNITNHIWSNAKSPIAEKNN